MTGGWRRAVRALPGSIRTRVTIVAALAVLAVLTAAAVGLVGAQRAALLGALDETLDRHADEVADRLRSGGSVSSEALPSEDVRVEVVDADGTVLAASPWAAGAGPDAEEELVVVREVDGVTVRVAASLDDVTDGTAALTASLLLAVPLTTAVLAGVVWWAVGRALRPVEDIRAQVERITAGRLDRRVPEPPTRDEVARLARTMNAMLDRLAVAADRQRRFVADAAHELRSPVARIRAELEVDRAHPEVADAEQTQVAVLGETAGLQRLVDDLLLLARGDAGALDVVRAVPVDLDDVVRRMAVRRPPGEPPVDIRDVAPVQVRGDEHQLERAVGNLLDNAVRHARSRITVSLREEPPGTAALVVADDGPGIAPADADRIFERFTRLDDARSAAAGGAGLGLAIARDIAERHGGTLVLAPEGPGARFLLRLPAAGDPDEEGIGGSGAG